MPPTRPLPSSSDLAPGDHLCCLYDNEQDQRSLLISFILQGLEHNHQVVCIVDAHAMASILQHLQDGGLAADDYLRWGQLVILTQGDTYVRDGTFDPGRMIALLDKLRTRPIAIIDNEVYDNPYYWHADRSVRRFRSQTFRPC
jgi:hypothetical protein